METQEHDPELHSHGNEADIDVKEYPLIYHDFEDKVWYFKRTKNPRAFIRHDGAKFSHTHVLFNYEYKGKAYYKTKHKQKALEAQRATS